MIISPLFLKDKSNSEDDASWVSRMMPVDPERGFPLNSHRSWHGGIHIPHTDSGGTPEKIRAIADGTVHSLRQPVGDKKGIPPYNYNGATDCGYVLLKHETEIGSGENAKVVYFSLYMHLASIDAAVKTGEKIYRKDPIGTVGQVDGGNAVHFQIFCDDTNLTKLVGRTTPELDLTKNGRTDAVYGDMYFYLPTGTKFYSHAPANNATTTTEAETYTSTEPLFVSMSFDKGKCTMLTRKKGVFSIGKYREVGEKLENADGADYEYNLYAQAKKLYPQSQSAGYELLRFGRVINTDYETLVPADAPLWRTISYPGGKGVVNLALPAVKKFSDGDFPHWTGWQLIDDDTDENSQCNSEQVLCRIGDDMQGLICHLPLEWDASTLEKRLSWLKTTVINESLANQKASHQVDDTGNNASGYAFDNINPDMSVLNAQSTPSFEQAAKDTAMAEADWNALIEHAKALCFDVSGLPAGRVWHFNPISFIAHFRKCGWVENSVLSLILSSNTNKAPLRKSITEAVEKYGDNINRIMLKYIMNTPIRRAHFIGQGAVESDYLMTIQEVSQKQDIINGKPVGGDIVQDSKRNERDLGHWYGEVPTEIDVYFSGKKYNKKGSYIAGSYSWSNGNCGDIDAQKFRGRGFKMLTGRANYASYWVYRGWLQTNDFDAYWWDDSEYKKKNTKKMKKKPAIINSPQKVTENEYNCIDTGGYFIRGIKPKTIQSMDDDKEYIMNKGQGENENRVIERVTKAINGADKGLEQRKFFTKKAKGIMI
ncbi:M23 family metallopeptidase [Yersinia pseudotuberculosis]|uniref:M23 family metallopeptidase n=2 Tax=Yersinia pseudotuberculosis TaxID=633 RepID=UPI0005E26CE3|nr:M23 family metallopeptidase [Yersinia pseudotuberculosis]AXY33421.1 M23 family peptidase [Yersinia pseudotuberculosis]MBO1568217.1 peptidoglycan DD-metalloendopeptidase family protein [Yersinia pseudotuberculosis]MBO1587703.1 peptidoglycan DD-metalloendopeptidase family protein [Yersinia pseudotuberculosis]MBO1604993.1 peptidoglycan DD-metalloendopeptidase family protein [Yersinia pseudotuberculosis]PEI12992.1 M23 family peptidase [Yersinia pseudotuberculosis]